jgi:copper transport protein
VALASVISLAATGVGEAIIHTPAVNALWETGFGRALLVKAGLLVVALGLAAGNLLRTKPQLAGAGERADHGAPAASLLSRLISGEAIVIVGAPAFAEQNSAIASVGPGHVAASVDHAGYRLQVLVSPNKAAAPNSFALRITRNGQPVRGANVTLAFNHLEMEMPQQEYQLKETAPGVYSHSAPALVMVGRWGLTFNITPPSGPPFTALIVDQANG